MPSCQPIEPVSPAAVLASLLLAAALACGGGDGAGQEAAAGSYFEDEESQARVEVDPCGLLTREEISEQLFLSLPAHQREHYTTDEFDIETAEPVLGVSRLCEYRFASRDSSGGGGPTWHSDFTLMVIPSNAIALAEDRRQPVEGGGSNMFKEPGTAAAYYVVKGGHGVSLARFPGRPEEQDRARDAGRVVLLSRIAERLP